MMSDNQNTSRNSELLRKILIGIPVGAMIVLTIYSVIFDVADGPKTTGGKLEKELKYDTSRLQKIRPEWVKYKQVASIATGMDNPRDIAISQSDVLYLAGDMSVVRLDSAGKRLSEIDLPAPPTSVCLWRQGILAGSSNKLIAWQPTWSGPKILHTFNERAMITATAGMGDDLFVADAGNRLVYHLDAKGQLLDTVKGPGTEGFVVPSPYFDLLIGPAGLLWVVNPGQQRIEAYTFSGDYEEPLAWGKTGVLVKNFSGCCNPTHIALLPSGGFISSEKGTPRVKVYSSTGIFECVVAGGDDFAPDTTGLALAADSAGRIFVLDPKRKTIRIFARKQP